MQNKSVLNRDDVALIVAACRVEAMRNEWPVTIAVVDDGERGAGGFHQRAVALKSAPISRPTKPGPQRSDAAKRGSMKR